MTKHIVIVGGGSAGWITAGLLASEHGPESGRPVCITLIESPDIKTVGVGEGTWPTMRSTLQKIGISENEFLNECSAAYKQGTQFVDWVTGTENDTYYHPFTPPLGYPRFDLAPFWQEHRDEVTFVDAVTAQGKLCDLKLAPKQAGSPDFAAVANYGYHLDAGRFADLLQRHCTQKLGVRHVLDNVSGVNGSPDEDIRSLSTVSHGEIEADLFVDCTGFAAILLGGHYGVPFLDRSDVLFNDSALAVQVPHENDTAPLASQTISTAQSAGWVWDIALTSRRGVGYTYSSAHVSDDEARATLRAYLAAQAPWADNSLAARKISFKPGHREKFWHRNCVAVGMSAGFLEPLEASALVLIELSASMISEQLPANRQVMDIVSRRFNETFLYRWDRIIDFLKLHYVLSQRSDSPYWEDHRRRSSIPDSLAELIELWQFHTPRPGDFTRIDEVFSTASYQYVLYGMGHETELGDLDSPGREQARKMFVENSQRVRKLIQQMPSHRDLLSDTTMAESSGNPGAQATQDLEKEPY